MLCREQLRCAVRGHEAQGIQLVRIGLGRRDQACHGETAQRCIDRQNDNCVTHRVRFGGHLNFVDAIHVSDIRGYFTDGERRADLHGIQIFPLLPVGRQRPYRQCVFSQREHVLILIVAGQRDRARLIRGKEQVASVYFHRHQLRLAQRILTFENFRQHPFVRRILRIRAICVEMHVQDIAIGIIRLHIQLEYEGAVPGKCLRAVNGGAGFRRGIQRAVFRSRNQFKGKQLLHRFRIVHRA